MIGPTHALAAVLVITVSTACGHLDDRGAPESSPSIDPAADAGPVPEPSTAAPSFSHPADDGPGGPAQQPSRAELERCYHRDEVDAFDSDDAAWYPLPGSGCSFGVSGSTEVCRARWTCCGDVFTLTYDRARGDLEVSYPTRFGVRAIRYAEQPAASCPLLDSQAAAVAAGAFGYSPAWYVAVQAVFGAPPEGHSLDPLPTDCELKATSADACGATLACAQHEYYAAFDATGRLACARDGTSVEPVAPASPLGLDDCDLSHVPADACFGPGWSRHFEPAARDK
jgi:hypothetical protein